MEPIDLLAAGSVLIIVLGVGTLIHELSHVVALHALGVACDIEWFPDRNVTGLASVRGTWATVMPRAITEDLAPWRLRIAALMPLSLATPILLALAGILPDPLASGDPVLASATVGWLACALPSPQDFSLVWHAGQAIEQYAT